VVRGSSSAFSLSNRTFGSSSCAACSNIGAMARHGPHQGAQTSTKTGRSLSRLCFSKRAPSTLAGWPSKSELWQFPHRAESGGLLKGSLFVCPQCGHTT
jgi:hypothetical protein